MAKYTTAQRVEAIRRVDAGEPRRDVSVAMGIPIGTIDTWRKRYGAKARRAAQEDAEPTPLVLAPPPPSRFTLDAVSRLREDIAHLEAVAAAAEYAESYVAALGYRKAARDLWDRLETLEREQAEGIDGADLDQIADRAIIVCRVPYVMEQVMADERCRKEADRWR